MTIKVNLCLIEVVNSTKEDTESLRNSLKKYSKEWEHHMRSQDPNGEYHCSSCVVVDTKQSRGLFFQPFMVKDQIPNYDQFTHWAIRGGWKSGIKGEAYIPSNKLAWYTGGVDTFVHETYHMLGRDHSDKDTTCILGSALWGLNAIHCLALGFVDKIVDVEKSSTVYIAPIEVDGSDLMDGEYHAIRIDDNGTKLLISRRKSHNQHFCGVKRQSSNTLYVHAPAANQWWRHATVLKGTTDSEIEIDGIVIRSMGDSAVQIIIDGEPAPDAPKPTPVTQEPGEPFTEDLSGIWADPRYEHQGVDLFVHDNGNRVTGYWYTYTPHGARGSALTGKESGKAWFVLDGKVDTDTNIVNLDIIQTKRREPKVVGTGTLRLLEGEILFKSDTENYGRDHWLLERISTPRQDPSGLYESGDNEGYSIAKYKDHKGEDIYVVYYYGYSTGGLEWYVYSGYNPNSLPGYNTISRYKETHDAKIEPIDPVDLDKIANLKKVL